VHLVGFIVGIRIVFCHYRMYRHLHVELCDRPKFIQRKVLVCPFLHLSTHDVHSTHLAVSLLLARRVFGSGSYVLGR
jgi:hypothetical protein